MIEVRTDLKTSNFRKTARQMLCNALTGTQLHHKPDTNAESSSSSKSTSSTKTEKKSKDLSEYIERELYKVTNRLINKPYKRTIRKLVFGMKHQDSLRTSVLDGSLSVEDLIKQNLQDG